MIIPMKKVTVLCLKTDRDAALNQLQEMGVLHLANDRNLAESQDRSSLHLVSGQLERVINILSGFAADYQDKTLAGSKVFETTLGCLNQKDLLLRDRDQVIRQLAELENWGEFDREELNRLRKAGVYVYLCIAPEPKYLDFVKDNPALLIREISRQGTQIYFAAVSQTELDRAALPLANLAEHGKNLSQYKKELKNIDDKLTEVEKTLIKLASGLDRVRDYQAKVREQLDFAVARDGMGEHGEICLLSGFVPAPEFPAVAEVAELKGWGYLVDDADPSQEAVPTLLAMPKWAKFIKPLFDFLAINPGYNEFDVSGVVAIFFTIFFGILIGDAGYGALFMLASLIAMPKFRKDPKVMPILKLIILLSSSALVWGVLTGNYFGLQGPGLPAMTEQTVKDQNTQLICFTLGILQLSIGHFWRMVAELKWRNILTQLGWVTVMVGNFTLINCMLVSPQPYPAFMKYCYIVGILMVAVGEVNWRDAGSIFGFPFSIINSFVDLLSYIRLFAVGMAGFYLAFSFNNMAMGVMKISALGVVGGIFILLIGHALNIGLAVLAVLVHGVRLNTLEFSSHIGLQWAGFAFRPFSKNIEENKQ